jgi:superfamily II DNA or RNA helicase
MAIQAGSFEYIEAKIRSEASGTEFGRDFEWLCKWYLENAAIYRGQFRKVWRWSEWPDCWGRDCGIDLIAETHDGEVYAIQCKAVSQEHTVTKAEIDSFLSESNRRKIDYRLLIATTDNIGANAMRTIENQAVHASVVLRGDLASAELEWPTEIGGAAPRPKLAKPKPHQKAAIKNAVAGFKKHDRGRLIMACGTGKTLTGLWVNEKLKSRRTLLLVPSISLVQQNLKEWGRHAKEDFDYLVVCSDESVTSDRDDPAMRYIADLGVKPTTDAAEIGDFLAKRRSRPALVISTYQSCDRVAKGQSKVKKKFDLTICDEAHRLVGHVDSHFATVLDDRKIRSQRRLFMTATPRYFTQRAKERGAEQDIELVSMDDEKLFGPEFHVLNFHDAITATPDPLLTDYQVVVIGVTSAEAKAWVTDAKLVRTRDGLETDARTLAAQIGLAKAMKQYNLTRMITFHRSIRRASRFVDDTQRDSLPAVIEKLRPASRPSGRLWARHVSGETPASKRASLVKELGELPSGVRGLISNCACLGEGVDVPALDGVAFIDPKGSVVDIIQAVGRVIRKAPDKKIGTIIIPVFVDESEDADHALEGSAFQPVWQVLKALRAHDRRLADELDQLRTSLGRQLTPGQHIQLPANIVLDVPQLLLADFEQAFYVRAVMAATDRPPLTIEQILAWADEHRARTGEWPKQHTGQILGAQETWLGVSAALRTGNRGLASGASLARILSAHRGVPNRGDLPPLSVEQILQWADEHMQRNGSWPTVKSGPVADTTWLGLAESLRNGLRGLPGGTSLSQLLHERRGVENVSRRPPLTERQLLAWVDAYKQSHGKWPHVKSEKSPGQTVSWAAIDRSLSVGGRGLPGGSSLADLLERQRNVRNAAALPSLSIAQILGWADEHKARTGSWPTKTSGLVQGTTEAWSAIDNALQRGGRGLTSGSSLPRLLAAERGVRNIQDRPDLTIDFILKEADRHKRRTGQWPKVHSGRVNGSDDTWMHFNYCLRRGTRGLPAGLSLAGVLTEHRGVPNRLAVQRLTYEQILAWADEHFTATGKWPNNRSGEIPGTNETWIKIDSALRLQGRGLPYATTLAQLLFDKRRVRYRKALPRLTIPMIIKWATAHQRAIGSWPVAKSGAIAGTGETWSAISNALTKGRRGLPGGSSLAQLLDEHRRGKA